MCVYKTENMCSLFNFRSKIETEQGHKKIEIISDIRQRMHLLIVFPVSRAITV